MKFTLYDPDNKNQSLALRPYRKFHGDFIQTYAIPEPYGRGSLRQISIQDGVDLFIAKYSVDTELHFHIDMGEPAFEMGFCLSGKGGVKLPCVDSKDAAFPADGRGSGRCFLMFRHSCEAFVVDHADSYRLSLSVVVNPQLFMKIIQHEKGLLPPQLQLTANGLRRTDYIKSMSINTDTMDTLNRLLSPEHGLAHSQLHYRAKVYELLSSSIHRLTHPSDATDKNNGYNALRVKQAAEIMINSMDNPPTLTALTTVLGTSHATLNQEFRKAFGTTVFGYLRQIRLERAMDLLKTGTANVTEASIAVGYNSISTFSKAFYERYGMTPSSCRKKMAA